MLLRCCTRSLVWRPDCYGSLDPVEVPPKTPRVEITHTGLVGPLRISFIPLIDEHLPVGRLQITRVFHIIGRYYHIRRRCRKFPVCFRSIRNLYSLGNKAEESQFFCPGGRPPVVPITCICALRKSLSTAFEDTQGDASRVIMAPICCGEDRKEVVALKGGILGGFPVRTNIVDWAGSQRYLSANCSLRWRRRSSGDLLHTARPRARPLSLTKDSSKPPPPYFLSRPLDLRVSSHGGSYSNSSTIRVKLSGSTVTCAR